MGHHRPLLISPEGRFVKHEIRDCLPWIKEAATHSVEALHNDPEWSLGMTTTDRDRNVRSDHAPESPSGGTDADVLAQCRVWTRHDVDAKSYMTTKSGGPDLGQGRETKDMDQRWSVPRECNDSRQA